MDQTVLRHVACAGASLCAGSLYAALLISEPTNITAEVSTKVVGAIQIDADTTVSTGGKLYIDYGHVAYLPYSAGKNVKLTLDGGVLEFHYTEASNPNHLYWGKNGGQGQLVVKTGDNYANYLDVCPLAETNAAGFIDFVRLEGGTLRGDFSITNATGPARLTFAGGKAYCAKTDATRVLYSIGPDSELVLQGENGATLDYGLNQGEKQPSFVFASGEGTLTTAGDGDLRFEGNGGAPRVYFAHPAAQTTWGHAGVTEFKNCAWPVLSVAHGLPHGTGTGALKFSGTANYLDMNGYTSAVNGLLRDGTSAHYVTNSVPETEAELQFGAHDEDSVFQLDGVYGNVTVAKLGSGTLDVQRGAFGKIRVASGTLTVTNASVTVDELSVAAGATVTLKKNATVRKVTLAAGAMLNVNGCTLKVDEIEGLNDTTYTHPNNGAIEWHVRTPATVSTSYKHCGNIYLHTNLTVDAGTEFGLYGNSPQYVLYVPAAAGEEAVFTSHGYFYDPSGSVYARLSLGANGGRGSVVIDGGVRSGPNIFVVGAKAEPCDAGYIDALRIVGSGSVWTSGTMSGGRTDYPTRITFSGLANYTNSQNISGPYVNTRYWPDTILFIVSKNCRFDVVAEAGSAATFNLNAGYTGNSVRMNTGEGTLAFKQGPVVFYCHANGWFDGTHDPQARFVGSSSNYAWENEADMILRRSVKICAEAANVLPSGSRTGVIRYNGYWEGDYSILSIAGCNQAINGIAHDGIGKLYVTNTTDTVATLTVGGTGADCVFAPNAVSTNLIVSKVGAGTLVVSNAVMPRLDVSAGALRIASNGVSIEKLNLAAGTSLTVTNATLTVGELVIDGATVTIDRGTLAAEKVTCLNGGTYSFAHGGKLVCAGVAETVVDTADYPSKWTKYNVMDYGFASGFGDGTQVHIVKRNTDTFTYFHDGSVLRNVDVRAGRLRFGGSANTSHYPWWRLTIKKTTGYSKRTYGGATTNVYAGLGRWWVTTPDLNASADSPSLLPWGGSVDAGTVPADVPEDKWTAGKPWLSASGSESFSGGAQWLQPYLLGRPFYNNGYEYYYSTVFANRQPDPQDASTWETIVCHIAASTMNKVATGGYILSDAANTDNALWPVTWTVEGSSNGTDWQLLDVRTNVSQTRNGWFFNRGNLYLFNQYASAWTFRPQGVVTVAADAILDLDEIPEANIALAKLTVDQAAGAGTITVFAPAADGELRLVNVPADKVDASGFLLRRLIVPITLGKTVSAANLASWRIFVNGVEQPENCSAKIDDEGRLVVRCQTGLSVLIK